MMHEALMKQLEQVQKQSDLLDILTNLIQSMSLRDRVQTPLQDLATLAGLYRRRVELASTDEERARMQAILNDIDAKIDSGQGYVSGIHHPGNQSNSHANR